MNALPVVLSLAALMPPHCVAETTELTIDDCLVLPSVGRAGRSPVHTDALEALIVGGRWSPPAEGDTVALPDGSTRTWTRVTADAEGWIAARELRGGYAYAAVEAEADRVVLLEASGHSLVYVNGQLRAGDPYAHGWLQTPVRLHAGRNDLLFSVGRGRLQAKLTAPPAPVFLNLRDVTLPDLVVGGRTDAWAAVVVVNAALRSLSGLRLVASVAGAARVTTPVPALPRLSMRKVGFRLRGPAPQEAGESKLSLVLRGRSWLKPLLHEATVPLRVREPYQTRKCTFLSSIDGSVQYYAVNPSSNSGDGPQALFLTCHGAAVEGIGQSDAYSAKGWGHIVAPTNRRPYGFDWEDWGRLDAMEVLERAQQDLNIDQQRVYLTGHSMGGHGVWHLGLTYPERFAAIGPSASWISLQSYTGEQPYEDAAPVESILKRAASSSDTLSLVRNALHYGVYILHGEQDDNVRVEQARQMRDALAPFHADFVYHEAPGQGHWWNLDDEPGADCVDWAPMFDFFARHRRPTDAEVREIDFTTANPAVSASSHWAAIEAQQTQLTPSTVRLRCDPWQRRFTGQTANVARLSLRLDHLPPEAPVTVELDGQRIANIPWPADEPRLWLTREGETWSLSERPSPALKGPHRGGPFKEAFRNHVLFVYGNAGTREETAWAEGKARFDAETFYYRGNASVDVVADCDFDPQAEPDRSVILYGNAATNAAWRALLADSPVQVRRHTVRVGDRVLAGDDLACYFIQPRPGSDTALVGVVAGTGLPGMRLAERSAYFISGAAYPDLLVIGPEMLAAGAEGIRVAGFLGQDWSVARGDLAWRE